MHHRDYDYEQTVPNRLFDHYAIDADRVASATPTPADTLLVFVILLGTLALLGIDVYVFVIPSHAWLHGTLPAVNQARILGVCVTGWIFNVILLSLLYARRHEVYAAYTPSVYYKAVQLSSLNVAALWVCTLGGCTSLASLHHLALPTAFVLGGGFLAFLLWIASKPVTVGGDTPA